jgi:hypothetical protein
VKPTAGIEINADEDASASADMTIESSMEIDENSNINSRNNRADSASGADAVASADNKQPMKSILVPPKGNRSRLMEKLGMTGGGAGVKVGAGRFERTGVGRVLRPQPVDWDGMEESSASQGLSVGGGGGGEGRVYRDPRALQRLWGQGDDGDDEDEEEDDGGYDGGYGGDYDNNDTDDDDNDGGRGGGRKVRFGPASGSGSGSGSMAESQAHRERLQGMRARTGLQFASNPREFDRSGLPK